MKKKLILAAVSLIVVVGIIMAVKAVWKNAHEENNVYESKWRDEGWEAGEYPAYLLRVKYPTDIIWYGNWDDRYPWEIPVRFESEVTNQVLTMRDGFQYVYIVVNDLDGNCDLTDDDYQKIANFVNNSNRYHFIYVGCDPELVCSYFLDKTDFFNEEDNVFALFHYPGSDRPTACTSIFSEETEEERSDTQRYHLTIVEQIVFLLEDCYPEE